MSGLEQIFDDAKRRLDILREYIARGAYDSEVKLLQEKFQEILTTSLENIRQKLNKRRGLFNRNKIRKQLISAYKKIEDLVNEYTDDLANRKTLINYYKHNDTDDPKSCKNMSESKCVRADNISSCRWVHGSDKLGDYLPRREGETGPLTLFGDGSEPKGCYPISKSDTLRSLLDSSLETTEVDISIMKDANGLGLVIGMSNATDTQPQLVFIRDVQKRGDGTFGEAKGKLLPHDIIVSINDVMVLPNNFHKVLKNQVKITEIGKPLKFHIQRKIKKVVRQPTVVQPRVAMRERDRDIMVMKPSPKENEQMSNAQLADCNLRKRESRKVLTTLQKMEKKAKKQRHAKQYGILIRRLKAKKKKGGKKTKKHKVRKKRKHTKKKRKHNKRRKRRKRRTVKKERK
jgi:hypothetical protein